MPVLTEESALLPHVMGIVNVTPDSFSDGGRFLATDAALSHGRHLRTLGAGILDIGGESTRPGATRPVLAEELDRVIPVVRELSAEGAVISVDTMRSEVAEAAIEAGATIINDVSGGLADPRILEVVGDSEADYVCMHWRAHSTAMQKSEFMVYADGVGATVRTELEERVEAALAAGIDRDRLILDPGLGFSKTTAQNWAMLRELDELDSLGLRVLVGASRKRFLGELLASDDGELRPVVGREFAHAAIVAMMAVRDVWALRVHDVEASVDVIRAVREMTK